LAGKTVAHLSNIASELPIHVPLHCEERDNVTKPVSFGAIALAALCSYVASAQEVRKAPELAYTVPGQGEKLLSQYRGKVVALEFILTTCPHCQAAARLMTTLQQEYGPRGFQALDIAINTTDEQVVEAFVRNFQVGFPVGYTPQDQA